MRQEHSYFVYILASRSRTLYVGVTSNLSKRVSEHRDGIYDSFTKRYRIHRLVYFEQYSHVQTAISREKSLKHFTRAEKLALIQKHNVTWADLSGFHGFCIPATSGKAGPPATRKDDSFGVARDGVDATVGIGL